MLEALLLDIGARRLRVRGAFVFGVLIGVGSRRPNIVEGRHGGFEEDGTEKERSRYEEQAEIGPSARTRLGSCRASIEKAKKAGLKYSVDGTCHWISQSDGGSDMPRGQNWTWSTNHRFHRTLTPGSLNEKALESVLMILFFMDGDSLFEKSVITPFNSQLLRGQDTRCQSSTRQSARREARERLSQSYKGIKLSIGCKPAMGDRPRTQTRDFFSSCKTNTKNREPRPSKTESQPRDNTTLAVIIIKGPESVVVRGAISFPSSFIMPVRHGLSHGFRSHPSHCSAQKHPACSQFQKNAKRPQSHHHATTGAGGRN